LSTTPSGKLYSDWNRAWFSIWVVGGREVEKAFNQNKADERKGRRTRMEGRVKP
jgi:hypothetical protein